MNTEAKMISSIWTCMALLIGIWWFGASDGSEVLSAENGPEGVIWVVQISDLHLSVHQPDRAQSLGSIMGKALSMIKPSLVLITGDLTDAKSKDYTMTRQDEAEWLQYQKTMQLIMKESGLTANSFFDLRGNHDKFGVPYTGSQEDYFLKYSINAYMNRTSQIESVTVVANGGDRNLFVGVDFSMDVGLRGPCNLFGHPSDDLLSEMNSALGQWDSSSDPVTKIVFGHFPMSFTASTLTGKRPEEVFARHNISAYICGHLHTKFGKHLYKHHDSKAFGSGDFWEWEMGDWRKSRMMRILAIDNGHASFVDASMQSYTALNDTNTLGLPTIVLPTFPLDSRSMHRRNPYASSSKTHPVDRSIRALVFSKEHLVSVSARIYDSATGKMVLTDELLMHPDNRINEPFYRVEWEVDRYSDPSPTRFWLQVHANNSLGKQFSSDLRPFSADSKASPLRSGMLHFLVMGIVWDSTYYPLSWGIIFLIFGLLLIPKLCSLYYQRLDQQNIWGLELFVCRTNMSILSRLVKTPLWFLVEGAENHCVWWLEIAYVLYLVLFPWFWGLVLTPSTPSGYMTLRGFTVRSSLSTEHAGLGVPDVIVIVEPFLYFILLPVIVLNSALSAEASLRLIHASSKFKCCRKWGSRYSSHSDIETKHLASLKSRGNNGDIAPLVPKDSLLEKPPSDGSDLLHRKEAPSCRICRKWLRKLILGGSFMLLLLHLRQCIFLCKAYGAEFVLSSLGYVWPVPVLSLVSAYTTSSGKVDKENPEDAND